MVKKEIRRKKIHWRIRKKISGSLSRPRLAVYRSNAEIYAQLIDDLQGHTLCASSSLQKEIAGTKGNKSEKSKLVGVDLAKKAVAAGISECVFDRGGNLYHGRTKALAEGAREGGLKF